MYALYSVYRGRTPLTGTFKCTMMGVQLWASNWECFSRQVGVNWLQISETQICASIEKRLKGQKCHILKRLILTGIVLVVQITDNYLKHEVSERSWTSVSDKTIRIWTLGSPTFVVGGSTDNNLQAALYKVACIMKHSHVTGKKISLKCTEVEVSDNINTEFHKSGLEGMITLIG